MIIIGEYFMKIFKNSEVPSTSGPNHGTLFLIIKGTPLMVINNFLSYKIIS